MHTCIIVLPLRHLSLSPGIVCLPGPARSLEPTSMPVLWAQSWAALGVLRASGKRASEHSCVVRNGPPSELKLLKHIWKESLRTKDNGFLIDRRVHLQGDRLFLA